MPMKKTSPWAKMKSSSAADRAKAMHESWDERYNQKSKTEEEMMKKESDQGSEMKQRKMFEDEDSIVRRPRR